MTQGLLFTIGTLATWVAFVLTFLVVRDAILLLKNSPHSRGKGTLITNGIAAFALFVIGVVFSKPVSQSGLKLPLVWFVMPWTAWLATGFGCAAIFNLAKSLTSISSADKTNHLRNVGVSGASAIAMVVLYFMIGDSKIQILTGGIPVTGPMVGYTVVILVLALFAVIGSVSSAKVRGLSKSFTTLLGLLAGSVVFGIPFVFLLVTSFKEDKDMTSKAGIIWVPRVTDTYPYSSTDESKKHYVTEYNGRQVEALILGQEGDKLKMDIFKPLSIRGISFLTTKEKLKEVPVDAKIYTAVVDGQEIKGFEKESLEDGRRVLSILEPEDKKGSDITLLAEKTEPVRHIGLRTQNYSEALEYMPPETLNGLIYLKNTLFLVVMCVTGTVLSCSIVAYAFSRMKFPGKDMLFNILLATMMLPGAVTLLPQFLIYRTLGWVDTLNPLWVPAFFGSAFYIFLLRQFFSQIPMELEDAAKIDGCNYVKAFWDIMLPQIKPALAVVAVGTFLATWNNFMGPLIYINSPENMPLSYALQLFKGDRTNEPGMLMAFTTMSFLPVVGVFFFAQKYFIEGVTLSGFGGR